MVKTRRRVHGVWPLPRKKSSGSRAYILGGFMMALFCGCVSGFLSQTRDGRRPLMKITSDHPEMSAELHHRHRLTALLAINHNSTMEQFPHRSYSPVSFQVEDQGIIACDTFAIMIACQLMGLVDVLNDPEFSRTGGWLQPIPLVPPTLGNLVERIVLFAFIWFPVSVIRFSAGSLSSSAPMDGKNVGGNADDDGGTRLGIQTVALFGVARIALAVASSAMTHSNVDPIDTLRDCYFVALATISFRFLYRQYFG